MKINKVAVIGAGVMGANIAAHLSNAGINVILLDRADKNSSNPNLIAETALRKLTDSKPAAFMHKKNAQRIKAGNIDDHLIALQDVDWVIEAIVENLKVKQSLYRQLENNCRPDTAISSNTSTLPLHLLTQGFDEAFQKRFLITHFFNPPRYMRLLEIIAGSLTDESIIDAISEFADLQLGKGCVFCHDTPGFIANRIGTFWLQLGMTEAFKMGLTVEEADAALSIPLGIPKTGIFGLLDLIGIDLMPLILDSMQRNLPDDDALQSINEIPGFLAKMLAEGAIGRKAKGGFYRLNTTNGKPIKESRSLLTGIYHRSEKPQLDHLKPSASENLPEFFEFDDKTSRYAWRIISGTILYAAELIPEIAEDISAIDQAMRLGFNWRYGPFEMYDLIGSQWFNQRILESGKTLPELLRSGKNCYKKASGTSCYLDKKHQYHKQQQAFGIIHLREIKQSNPPVAGNSAASLWDIGDGVLCLEFHSKMNTLDMLTMELIHMAVETVKQQFSALVIYNEAENFSAGANLGLLVSAIEKQHWPEIENMLLAGQQAFASLKSAHFPVIGAPSGLALGGGCEVLLHCDQVVAHAEFYTGLVEVGVGVIPSWGGCKELLIRCLTQPKKFGGPIPPVVKAFETIALAKTSSSAFEAQDLLYLSKNNDHIIMNRDRLLFTAKQTALQLVDNYTTRQPFSFPLPGMSARIMLHMAVKSLRLSGKVSDYDVIIAEQLASILSGGKDADLSRTLSEQQLYTLEREAFMTLIQQKQTLDRLKHMLSTGKPLRN